MAIVMSVNAKPSRRNSGSSSVAESPTERTVAPSSPPIQLQAAPIQPSTARIALPTGDDCWDLPVAGVAALPVVRPRVEVDPPDFEVPDFEVPPRDLLPVPDRDLAMG
jgi:hypothetical protein